MNKTLIETINLKKTYQHSNGNITLNGDNIALSVAQTIVSMGIENEDDDGNIVYKPIEIIGIEVSD